MPIMTPTVSQKMKDGWSAIIKPSNIKTLLKEWRHHRALKQSGIRFALRKRAYCVLMQNRYPLLLDALQRIEEFVAWAHP